jgi:hypothetical protein
MKKWPQMRVIVNQVLPVFILNDLKTFLYASAVQVTNYGLAHFTCASLVIVSKCGLSE